MIEINLRKCYIAVAIVTGINKIDNNNKVFATGADAQEILSQTLKRLQLVLPAAN